MHASDLLAEGHHPEQRLAVPEVQAAARLGRPPASKLRSAPRDSKGDSKGAACAEERQQTCSVMTEDDRGYEVSKHLGELFAVQQLYFHVSEEQHIPIVTRI